jgi:hypothetical protein
LRLVVSLGRAPWLDVFDDIPRERRARSADFTVSSAAADERKVTSDILGISINEGP